MLLENSENKLESNDRFQAILEIIKKRRSVRSYTGKTIPMDTLLELTEAGVYAPSGSNAQNQRFLLINDPNEIKAIGEQRWVLPYPSRATESERRAVRPQGILEGAGGLILVFSDNSKTDPRDNGEYFIWKKLEIQNCSASIQNILLAATAKGIGSVWVSSNEEMNFTRLLSGSYWKKVLKNYEIPDHYSIQGMVVLGYSRHMDESGFPTGEKKHGVVWSETARKPVETYIIQKCAPSSASGSPVSYMDRLKLRVITKVVQASVRLTHWCMKKMFAIEKRYL